MNWEPNEAELESQLENVWRQLAVQRGLGLAAAMEAPEALVIAGQPGSGKSSLIESFRSDCTRRGGVVIDSEEILLTHPAYPVFADTNSADELSDSLDALRTEAAEVAGQMLIEACRQRCCVVSVNRFQSVESAETLFDFLKASGYAVHVAAPLMAASRSRSNLSRRGNETLARRTSVEEHDALLATWLQVLDWIEEQWPVEQLQLLPADGEPWIAYDPPPRGSCRAQYARLEAHAATPIQHPRFQTQPPPTERVACETVTSDPALSDPVAQRKLWQAALRRRAQSDAL